MANLRHPVRFSQAIAAAGADHSTFVEISPHPLLTHAITETLADAHHHASGTLSRDTHDTLTFHTNLNATHTTHPPTHRPPTRTPPAPTHHPLAPHPPLDHHQRSAAPRGQRTRCSGIGVTDPTNGTRVWESTLGPDLSVAG